MAREEFGDPDLAAEDAQLLTSHRHDRLRVFNLGFGQFHYATSADGRSGVLHTIAFPMPYPRGEMAAWFQKPWARGRVLSVGSETMAKRAVVDGGVEFHLSAPPVYTALEVSAVISRRQFLAGSAALGAATLGRVPFARSAAASTVAVAKCDTYGPELVETLDRMFDQIGGLGRLVRGRTVAVKLNLTGPSTVRLGLLPPGMALTGSSARGRRRRAPDGPRGRPSRPAARGRLRDRHPARRVHVPGGLGRRRDRRRGRAGSSSRTRTASAAGRTTTASTCRAAGCFSPRTSSTTSSSTATRSSRWARSRTTRTTGVTLSMKNCFGNIPTTIYGDHVPKDRPDERPRSGRNFVFHDGLRQPASPAAPEIDPGSPRHEGLPHPAGRRRHLRGVAD